MKNQILCAVAISWLQPAQAQEGGVIFGNLFPDRTSSTDRQKIFQSYFGLTYLLPRKETSDFQKSRLGDVDGRGKFYEGKMEWRLDVPWWDCNHDFEPSLSFRLDAFPMHFSSSQFGIRLASRELHSSFEIFTGQYYRRVPEGGNFTTRRAKQFDTYPFYGWSVETSLPHFSFFFSTRVEHREIPFNLRAASRIGHTFRLGGESSLLRSTEIVLSWKEFYGKAAGLSVAISPHVRFEVLWTDPEESDSNDQARIGEKLTSSGEFNLWWYVD